MPRQRLASGLFLLLLVGTPRGEVTERCDFEIDECGWQNTGTDGKKWKREMFVTNSPSGPQRGNGGTGFYMYLDGSDFENPEARGNTLKGNVTLLSRNMTSRESPACFRLFFYMWETLPNAATMGNLTAGINTSMGTSVRFSKQGKQSANWICGNFTIPSQSSQFQIFVTATVGSNPLLADIAVDDFALFNVTCDALTREVVCDASAGKPPASSTVETATVSSSSSSAQGIQSSSTSSSAASSSALPPDSASRTDSSTEPPVEGSFNTLVLLVIPAAVLLLAIPVAAYCFWRRRKMGPPIVFEPYAQRESMEVYDELGPIEGDYTYLKEDYADIKDADLEDKAGEAQPPLPCRPGVAGPSSRDLDTPPPEEEAPRRPSLSYLNPAALDRKQQCGDDLQAGEKEGRARPNPYLEMGSLLRKKPGRPVSSDVESYLEPVAPASAGSAYLDMENQAPGFPSSARSGKTGPGGGDTTSDYLDPDYTNEGGQSTGNYLTLESRGESGRGSADAASYVEPGTPTSRGSTYLDMENQAAGFSFPVRRSRKSGSGGEDTASDYLDPDYMNHEGKSTENYLTPKSRDQSGRGDADAASYVEPGTPTSRGSTYLDMENQTTAFPFPARSRNSGPGDEDTASDYLDPDYINNGGRGESGRGSADVASYVEPGSPSSRGSTYLDMENQATAFPFPARSGQSAPEDEDTASDYLDPDYMNNVVESPGNCLTPKSRKSDNVSD